MTNCKSQPNNSAEQIIKADRLRMSRPLQNSKARAMLRRLNSTVLRFEETPFAKKYLTYYQLGEPVLAIVWHE